MTSPFATRKNMCLSVVYLRFLLETSISTRKRWTVLIKYEIIYNLLEILPGVGDIFA
jgi:hypothetical protein